MPKRQTTTSALDKYHISYHKLVDYGIRLDKEIYLMKQRMAKIAVDEAKYLGRRSFLNQYLAKLRQQEKQAQAETNLARYQKGKVEKLAKALNKTLGQWHANEWHISVLYSRKKKDNIVKLILKENKRAEVQSRVETMQVTLTQLQQIRHQELESLTAFKETVLQSVTAKAEKVTVSASVCIANGSFLTTSLTTIVLSHASENSALTGMRYMARDENHPHLFSISGWNTFEKPLKATQCLLK